MASSLPEAASLRKGGGQSHESEMYAPAEELLVSLACCAAVALWLTCHVSRVPAGQHAVFP
eukprot:COSAG01_NODE_3137_length_6528_cov_3.708819_3_plen_61_part_00